MSQSTSPEKKRISILTMPSADILQKAVKRFPSTNLPQPSAKRPPPKKKSANHSAIATYPTTASERILSGHHLMEENFDPENDEQSHLYTIENNVDINAYNTEHFQVGSNVDISHVAQIPAPSQQISVVVTVAEGDKKNNKMDYNMQQYTTIVREHFIKESTSGFICNYCEALVEFKKTQGGNDITANYMWRHLRYKHKETHTECQKVLDNVRNKEQLHAYPAMERQNRSITKQFFNFQTETETYFCILCGTGIKRRYDPSGADKSTTDFWRHLKRKHPDKHAECQKQKESKDAFRHMVPDSEEFQKAINPVVEVIPANNPSVNIVTVSTINEESPFKVPQYNPSNLPPLPVHNFSSNGTVQDFSSNDLDVEEDDFGHDFGHDIEPVSIVATEPRQKAKVGIIKTSASERNMTPDDTFSSDYNTRQYVSIILPHFLKENSQGRVCNVCSATVDYRCTPQGEDKTAVFLWRHMKYKHEEVHKQCAKQLNEVRCRLRPSSDNRVNSSHAKRYFHFISKADGYICKLCEDRIACRFDPHGHEKTATDFWRHLKRKHKDHFADCKKSLADRNASLFNPVMSFDMVTPDQGIQMTSNIISNNGNMNFLDIIINDCGDVQELIVQNKDPSGSIVTDSDRQTTGKMGIASGNLQQDKIDALIMQWMTSELKLISFVENQGFLNMMKALDPEYDVPNEEKVSEKLLPQTYEAVKWDVKLTLKLTDLIAISMESWTSQNGDQYVTIVAYFFSSCLQEQKSFVLSTIKICDLSCETRVEELATKLHTEFLSWEIEGKICVVVTDNSPILASVTLHLGLQHVPCLETFLDQALTSTVKTSESISSVVKRVKELLLHFDKSSDAPRVLEELSIPNICSTLAMDEKEKEWISTLKMFRTYIELHEQVSTAMCLLSEPDKCITENDVGIMKKMIETVEPFELAIQELKNKSLASLSIIVPLLKQLQDCLLKIQYSDFVFSAELLADISQLLASVQSNFFVNVSTILDPCFKHLPFVGDLERVKNIESWLLPKLSEMYQSASTAEPAKPKKNVKIEAPSDSLWSNINITPPVVPKPPPMIDPTTELRQYFGSSQPKRQETSPVDWWKSNKASFPNLTKLAKQFLAMPAIVAPTTSMKLDVFLDKRSRLEDHVDEVLFLHHNFKTLQQVLKW